MREEATLKIIAGLRVESKPDMVLESLILRQKPVPKTGFQPSMIGCQLLGTPRW
jgi:hypothetical protein